MTLAALRPVGSAGLALGRIYAGQFVKVLLTVAMFYAVARTSWVVWPPAIGAYIATMVVSGYHPACASPSAAAIERQGRSRVAIGAGIGKINGH